MDKQNNELLKSIESKLTRMLDIMEFDFKVKHNQLSQKVPYQFPINNPNLVNYQPHPPYPYGAWANDCNCPNCVGNRGFVIPLGNVSNGF